MNISNTFDAMLNMSSDNMSIPYQIYDEVLREDCVKQSYLKELYNRTFADCLATIDIKIRIHARSRFTRTEQLHFFTREYIIKTMTFILERQLEGDHPDCIAIELLYKDLLHQDDIHVFFKGNKIGY